jgi:hypothetical protein
MQSFRPARVKSVETLGGFLVRIEFTDGTQKVIDLDRYIDGPIFQPLRDDPSLFRSVYVDGEAGTIVWPNGADLDPDVLRYDLAPAEWEDTAPATSAIEDRFRYAGDQAGQG